MPFADDGSKLGQRLISLGLIDQKQINVALLEQQVSGERLGVILQRWGWLTTTALTDLLAEQSGVARADLTHADPLLTGATDTDALWPRLDLDLLRRLAICPLYWQRGEINDQPTLISACADVSDISAHDAFGRHIAFICGRSIAVSVLLASVEEISQLIDRHAPSSGQVSATLEDAERQALVGEAPSMQAVIDGLLHEALGQRASDIHFTPEAHVCCIRYRIDGQLIDRAWLHSTLWPYLLTRLKIMSGMNIAEHHVAQDGRYTLPAAFAGGSAVDCRLSSQPTLHGENIVIRLLTPQLAIDHWHKLGFDAAANKSLATCLDQSEGLLIVSGPTGSGKTTTLFTLLKALAGPTVNVMTLEDPVEYQLAGARQTAVSDHLSFADGIRAALRQDPDVLMIGEIRDADTAIMALRAATTGVKVLSTVHAGAAYIAIPRLLDLGASPWMLASALRGVVCQRLLRRLCPHCKLEQAWPPQFADAVLKRWPHVPQPALSYAAMGCSRCHQGYCGRLAIAEVLPFHDQFADCLSNTVLPLAQAITASARARSPDFALFVAGLALAARGETSLAEVWRVASGPAELSPLWKTTCPAFVT